MPSPTTAQFKTVFNMKIPDKGDWNILRVLIVSNPLVYQHINLYHFHQYYFLLKLFYNFFYCDKNKEKYAHNPHFPERKHQLKKIFWILLFQCFDLLEKFFPQHLK